MNKVFSTLMLGMGLLAGCVAPTWLSGSSEGVTLRVRAELPSGQASYRTLGAAPSLTLNPYTSASIDHLVLRVFTVTGGEVATVSVGGQPLQATLAQGDLGATVTFKNLHPSTTYRVQAYAYKDSSSATDSVISIDASSSAEVSTGNNLVPTLDSVPVILMNRLFQATATGTVAVTNGSLTHVDEAIVLPTPLP